MDGCSFHHDNQVQAGAGITWVNYTVNEPNKYQLGTKTSQYDEIFAVVIMLQQAVKLAIVQQVVCSVSNLHIVTPLVRISCSCFIVILIVLAVWLLLLN